MKKSILTLFVAIFALTVAVTSCKKIEVVVTPTVSENVAARGAATNSATAAASCQCVGYIKNRFNITSTNVDAKDYGTVLITKGYRKLPAPVNNCIVIFKPSYGSGISTTYGHIAVIQTWSNLTTGGYRINCVGANQGTPVVTEYNCTNVKRFLTTDVTPARSANVEYWVK